MSIQICDKIGTPEACSCDFLEIRDGKSSSDRLLATLCGDKLPGDLYSSGRHLWVRFSSDDSVSDSGFVASFSSAKIIEGGLNGNTQGNLKPNFVIETTILPFYSDSETNHKVVDLVL